MPKLAQRAHLRSRNPIAQSGDEARRRRAHALTADAGPEHLAVENRLTLSL
jgi:hypothetical protein